MKAMISIQFFNNIRCSNPTGLWPAVHVYVLNISLLSTIAMTQFSQKNDHPFKSAIETICSGHIYYKRINSSKRQTISSKYIFDRECIDFHNPLAFHIYEST